MESDTAGTIEKETEKLSLVLSAAFDRAALAGGDPDLYVTLLTRLVSSPQE
ncbi:MAG: hypothetical protein AAGF67_15925 [Verrucomicrobiota bacterium]